MTFFKNTLAAASALALVAVPMGAIAAPAQSAEAKAASAVAPTGPRVKAKSRLAPVVIALIGVLVVGTTVGVASGGGSNSPG